MTANKNDDIADCKRSILSFFMEYLSTNWVWNCSKSDYKINEWI